MDPLMRRLRRRLDARESSDDGLQHLVFKALMLGMGIGILVGLALLGALTLVGFASPSTQNILGFAIGGAYAVSAALCASAEHNRNTLS